MEQQEFTKAEIRDYRWSITSIVLCCCMTLGYTALLQGWIDRFSGASYVSVFCVFALPEALAMSMSTYKESPRTCRVTGTLGIVFCFALSLLFLLTGLDPLETNARFLVLLFILIYTVGCWLIKQRVLAILFLLTIYLFTWPGINCLLSRDGEVHTGNLVIKAVSKGHQCIIEVRSLRNTNLYREYDWSCAEVTGKVGLLTPIECDRPSFFMPNVELQSPANPLTLRSSIFPPKWAVAWSMVLHVPRIRKDIEKQLISDPTKTSFIPVECRYRQQTISIRDYRRVPAFQGAPMECISAQVTFHGYDRITSLGHELRFIDEKGETIEHMVKTIKKQGGDYQADIWLYPAPSPKKKIWVEGNRFDNGGINAVFRSLSTN